MTDVTIGGLTVGNDRPLLVIAGPCQLESLDHAQMIAGEMAAACAAAGASFVFKASYDKANRTSLGGKRGLGMEVDPATETNEVLCSDKPGYVLLTNSRGLALSQCKDPEFFDLWLLSLIHHQKHAVKRDMCQ